MDRSLLVESHTGEVVCLTCLVARYCHSLIEYEKKALAADDPKGGCAAHHRGAIGAYKRILTVIREKK
jgi:hypothetical protein